MKKYLLLLILMVPMIISAQTQVPPGPVSGTWDLAGSPYMVNGEIYIDETATLEIEPGVEVRFKGWYKFIVNGSLRAVGTATDSILFTADDTTNRWHGLKFLNTVETSYIDYCIFEYGLTILDNQPQSFPDNAGAGILIYDSPLALITVKHSYFFNNLAYLAAGIGSYNNNTLIDSCKFIGNNTPAGGNGAGIYVMGGSYSSPMIKNCEFRNNSSGHRAGGVMSWACRPVISKSVFINNSCSQVGGAIFIGVTTDFTISDCQIVNNTAMHGGGIYLSEATGDCINNTIACNTVSNSGGGIYFYETTYQGLVPLLKNNIIYFNTASNNQGGHQVCLTTMNDDPDFHYCDIQDGIDGFGGLGSGSNFSGDYLYCIDGNPLFADTINEDYSLTWENYPWVDTTKSPCIDSGNSMFPDPDGTIIDIGANYFHQQLDIPVMKPPDTNFIGQDHFLAEWTNCFGALGYYLDVALDDAFANMVYENIQVNGDTVFLVEELGCQTAYYYRVRSYNTALTSPNSNNILVVTDDCVSVNENNIDELEIFSSQNRIYIKINENLSSSGSILVYNTAGQLLTQQQIHSGSNTIDPKVTDQIIFAKVILEGKFYQQKLLVK